MMTRRVVVVALAVLCLALASGHAQSPAPASPPAPSALDDTLDDYRRQVVLARQVTAATRAAVLGSEAYKAMIASKPYQDFLAAQQQQAVLERELGAKALAKTGKAMNWATGQLVDPPPAATK